MSTCEKVSRLPFKRTSTFNPNNCCSGNAFLRDFKCLYANLTSFRRLSKAMLEYSIKPLSKVLMSSITL
jgi:hypothetical protein